MTKKGARGEMAPIWAVLFLVQKGTFSTWGARGKWRQFEESLEGPKPGPNRAEQGRKKNGGLNFHLKIK